MDFRKAGKFLILQNRCHASVYGVVIKSTGNFLIFSLIFMKTVGNIIWLLCGGFAVALEYLVSSVAMMITIIGIPFGLQTLKLSVLALWPFGSEVSSVQESNGCLNLLMNVIWFFVGGIWIALTHLCFGILLCITIVGIPFGRQHFKMMALAFSPFGKEIK